MVGGNDLIETNLNKFDDLDGVTVSQGVSKELYTIDAKETKDNNADQNQNPLKTNIYINITNDVIIIPEYETIIFMQWLPSSNIENKDIIPKKSLFSSFTSYFTGDTNFQKAISFIYLDPNIDSKDQIDNATNGMEPDRLSNKKIEIKPCKPNGNDFTRWDYDKTANVDYTKVYNAKSTVILTPAGFCISNENNNQTPDNYYYYRKVTYKFDNKFTSRGESRYEYKVSNDVYPLSIDTFKTQVLNYYKNAIKNKIYTLSKNTTQS